MNWRELLLANIRLGGLLHRARWPLSVWVVGALLPEIFRMLVYVLIGYIVGDTAGLQFALVGCFALGMISSTVSAISDVPVDDVQAGTYRTVLLGSLSPFTQYLGRALVIAANGLVLTVIATSVVALVTGQGTLLLSLLPHTWMLVPAAFSTSMLGLLVIAPAIGSNWEGITYNTATGVLVVMSGAVFSLTNPAASAIGQALPLTHVIQALRLALEGQPYGERLVLEVLTGLVWGLAAYVLFRWQGARGKRTARGAFAA
ncbi:ABC transporter permease [Nesterenkonia muleiensis]|uniref:ABC transporter permease n=1 Tax=Nesterenkonia muleiensis TaxID=2282648 RepID=UPI000E7670A4|nr:ABC transporter permease [Nesterenkonia muleiensis]